MATAGDQINQALKMIGQLAEGETPSAETAQDALITLNQMLDSWSIEGLSIHSSQDQEFTWPAGQSSQTLGPTGDFIGNRPVSVEGISLDDVPVILLTEDEFYSEDGAWLNMTMPDATIHLSPTPTVNTTINVKSVIELTQLAGLTDDLIVPPGYLRAIKYNLAIELAMGYGVVTPIDVQRIAATSRKAIQRTNSKRLNTRMSLPSIFSRTYENIRG